MPAANFRLTAMNLLAVMSNISMSDDKTRKTRQMKQEASGFSDGVEVLPTDTADRIHSREAYDVIDGSMKKMRKFLLLYITCAHTRSARQRHSRLWPFIVRRYIAYCAAGPHFEERKKRCCCSSFFFSRKPHSQIVHAQRLLSSDQ